MKRILIAVIAVALVGAAFFGGTLYQKSTATAAGPGAAGGRAGAGGPMANLSTEEQAKIAAMSDTERQAYFETQRGSDANGAVGARGAGGGLVEGEVIDVASDTVTVKIGTNSQTIYIDDSTVVGYQEGADALAAGSSVLIYSTSTADNVVTATAILVKK
jgi:hypothetical protein